ncbi:hypothetical protein [Bradyrhizobium stylosanthis]|uniref:hypothetical protein n=1 Tax=Bradyrhizobium stylosanthis TaxID=1803665 RepID=UPI0012E89029|nr:hypothetical protein [Bradyrhizobium stylosanthis]
MSSRQSLLNIFNTRLGRVPMRAESELFAADLARTSHELLEPALRELAAKAATSPLGRDLRDQTLAVFHRKLAEQSRLFPLFFIFETAFRAFVAARMETIYRRDDWWRPIEAEIAANRNPTALSTLYGVRVPRDMVRTVEHILREAASTRRHTFSTGYQVIAAGTMAHVGKLIEQHWAEMVSVFNSAHRVRPQGRMTSSEFRQHFTLVRHARNDLYHHRAVPRQTRVVEVIDELISMLDLDLGKIYAELTSVSLNPLPFSGN